MPNYLQNNCQIEIVIKVFIKEVCGSESRALPFLFVGGVSLLVIGFVLASGTEKKKKNEYPRRVDYVVARWVQRRKRKGNT